MKQQRYTIGELAALTGVSRRTVRFYVQRGLIPPPLGAGRGSFYTDEHLGLIRGIRSRQAAPAPCSPSYTSPTKPARRVAVTRIELDHGVTIELSAGLPVPSDRVLGEIARILMTGECTSVSEEER